jgi:hypothetical protein
MRAPSNEIPGCSLLPRIGAFAATEFETNPVLMAAPDGTFGPGIDRWQRSTP